MKRKSEIRRAADEIRTYALSLPGAHEDFPWGERVMKVGTRNKVFVFLGKVEDSDGVKLCTKLPASAAEALELPFTEPAGYGLGKSGWVAANFGADDDVPVEMLQRWIEESYRAVAPKKLVAELDSRRKFETPRSHGRTG